jgi:hypothetical protein
MWIALEEGGQFYWIMMVSIILHIRLLQGYRFRTPYLPFKKE